MVTNDWYKAAMAYFLIVTLVRTYDEAARAFRVVAYALAVLAVSALVFGIEQEGRLLLPQGYFSNPNELGLAMLAGVSLWWALAHDPSLGLARRILAVALVPFMLFILLRTGSRSGLLCIATCLPFLFFQYSAAAKAKFLVVVAFLAVFSVAFLPGSLLHRFTTYFQPSASLEGSNTAVQDEEAIGSSNQRLALLRSSLSITAQHPLFGVGPGNFVVVDAEASQSKGYHPGWAGTHNTYMEIASEAGIPALLFFLAALVGCWRSIRKARRLNSSAKHPKKREIDLLCAGLQFTLAVFSFQFFFIHMAYSAIFPAIAGLCVVMSRAVETEVSAQSKPVAPVSW